MSVGHEQGAAGISFGTLATSLALFVFVVMLAVLGDRWAPKFAPLPDFSSYRQVKDMKAAFIDYLSPIVAYHNERILGERKRLLKVHDTLVLGGSPSYSESRWINQLAEKYGVELNQKEPVVVTQELLSRVDIVPVQLAVVQAAKESSWGRSRYAVQVNNMFGEWCYRKGCGIVPKDRSEGDRHEVRRFESVSESTRSYMHNLNSHHNYSSLRQLRQELRATGRAIEGGELVDGLLFYSERRQQYVDEIKSMIKQYSYFLRQQARADKA
ncbi:MAG: glucosaminidase domain-containing protein [Thiotrichales bacterium]|nr:MAG: glucosaminidase domain-containing protein [Thiotrichales bacterium]